MIKYPEQIEELFCDIESCKQIFYIGPYAKDFYAKQNRKCVQYPEGVHYLCDKCAEQFRVKPEVYLYNQVMRILENEILRQIGAGHTARVQTLKHVRQQIEILKE